MFDKINHIVRRAAIIAALSLVAGVQAQASIGVSPRSISFGNEAVGVTHVPLVVTLTNNNSSSLTITGASIGASQFAFGTQSFPVLLSPGATLSVSVTFTPTAAQIYSSTLGFVRQNGSTISVGLSGTGVQATVVQGQSLIRVHAGGAAYTDSLGQTWAADTGYSGGSIYDCSCAPSGTNDPTLYRTERWGASTYSFSMPAGNYAVTLKFAETSFTGPGQRVFNVAINGSTVLSNFDIYAASGGANIALDKTFPVTSSGTVSIQLIQGSADQPKVDAIQIAAAISSASSTLTAPAITAQPLSQTVTAGQTASFQVAATGTAPMTFQWSKNGAVISGATSSSYTTPATSTTDSGAQFAVVVSNTSGKAVSNAAVLTIKSASTAILNSSAASLAFGTVNVSGTSSKSVTLTNAGNANVNVSSVSVSGAGFAASGVSTGLILTPGQSATLTVTFTPAATGSLTGSVTVASNATNSPDSVSLSGAGASTVTHSVALAWNASPSSVIGYNTYSSSVSGGPYVKLTSSPVNGLNYTDTTVKAGQTYYYVVTSVNTANMESGYSGEVSTVVP